MYTYIFQDIDHLADVSLDYLLRAPGTVWIRLHCWTLLVFHPLQQPSNPVPVGPGSQIISHSFHHNTRCTRLSSLWGLSQTVRIPDEMSLLWQTGGHVWIWLLWTNKPPFLHHPRVSGLYTGLDMPLASGRGIKFR